MTAWSDIAETPTDVTYSLGAIGNRFITGYIHGGVNAGANGGTIGGNFTLTPEVGTTSGGNVLGGNFVVALQTPTGTGLNTESSLQVTRGGALHVQIGPVPTVGSALDAVWLGPGIAPNSVNYVLGSDGTANTYLKGPTGLVFEASGTAAVAMNASALYSYTDLGTQLGGPTLRWSTLYVKSGVSAGTSASGAGSNMTVQAESAKSGSNANGGNLILIPGTKDGSGANGTIDLSGSQNVTVSTLKTSSYPVVKGDYLIAVGTLSGIITVTLPSSPVSGDTYIVKDCNGSAATYNITVSGNGNNIDGASTYVVSNNYAALTLVYTTANQWAVC